MFLVFLIRIYKYILSPLLASHCRFYPTCSTYAIMAITQCNIITAFFLIIKRLMKCNPFFEGGYDPL